MAKQSKSIPQKKKVQWEFPFSKMNFIIFGVGIAVIIVGYLLMGTGITDDPKDYQTTWNNPLAISVAPFLLVLGYCVIIPYSIIVTFKKSEPSE